MRQYNNVGSATFQGVEVIGGWQPLKDLRLNAGFTATRAYLTSSNYPTLELTGVQLGQVPNWIGDRGSRMAAPSGACLHRHPEVVPRLLERHRHTQLNGAATLIDLGVTYSPAKAVDIYGSIQNLTNANYLATGYTLTSFEGPTVSTTSIPTLGMPLTVIVGLR